MYLLDLPRLPYTDPWNSSYERQIRQLAGPGLRIAYYYDRPDNSTFRYRVYNMIQAFAGLNMPVSAAYFTASDLSLFDEVIHLADMLIVCRAKYTPRLDAAIMRAKNKGVRVLYDVDDYVFDPLATGLILDTLDQNTTDIDLDFWFAYLGRNGAALHLCDGAITTNSYLAERINRVTGKPTHVIPNFMNSEQIEISERVWERKEQQYFARNHQLHLGYFSGTPSHNKDFDIVLPTLTELLRTVPDLIVRVVGYMPEKELLKPYRGRVEYLPFIDFINLQRLIGETEINLVPLQDNEFTNCKSELKFFEAGIVGALTVASPVGGFTQNILHGENGYLANSYQWFEVLENVVRNYEGDSAVVRAARQYSIDKFAWFNQSNILQDVFFGTRSDERV
jgi:glycosyltransferase involved in cell wall biosynthesis